MLPWPSVASIHCSRTLGLSASFSVRMARNATRSLLITSTWVAINANGGLPPKLPAVRGSGLKSTTTDAAAV